MKKTLMLILIGCFLSGCSFFRVHKMDIEQGNIITQEQISQLHSGMSFSQVKAVMGTPVLVNIFSPNRIEYVYWNKPAYGDLTEKRVSLIFVGGRLSQIERR